MAILAVVRPFISAEHVVVAMAWYPGAVRTAGQVLGALVSFTDNAVPSPNTRRLAYSLEADQVTEENYRVALDEGVSLVAMSVSLLHWIGQGGAPDVPISSDSVCVWPLDDQWIGLTADREAAIDAWAAGDLTTGCVEPEPEVSGGDNPYNCPVGQYGHTDFYDRWLDGAVLIGGETMYLGDTARDAQYVNYTLKTPFGTTATRIDSGKPSVRTTANINDGVAELAFKEDVTVAAGKEKAAGLLFPPASELGDETRVLYRVNGRIWLSKMPLLLGIGLAATAPTNAAAGNVVTRMTVIEVSVGGVLFCDRLLAVEPVFSLVDLTDVSDLQVVFAVMARNATGKSITDRCEGAMSVQRLVGPSPPMFDRRLQ